jgi:hypothetical protein
MKSVEKIRRHRDNLLFHQKQPCDCSGTNHEEDCYRGLMMMESALKTLSWALGEFEEMEEQVSLLEADRQAIERSN